LATSSRQLANSKRRQRSRMNVVHKSSDTAAGKMPASLPWLTSQIQSKVKLSVNAEKTQHSAKSLRTYSRDVNPFVGLVFALILSSKT